MTAAKNVREALLPCPFCGGVVETYQQTSKVPDNWVVRCDVCGAQCGPSASSTAARYNWNTRPALLASLSATAAGDAKDGYFVWHQGSPRSFWGEEWFIAKLDDGDHVVLRALPEEWTYDFTTADHTYYKAARIKQWMQFDTSQYKPFAAQESP